MKKSPFPYIMALGCIVFFIIAGIQYQQNQPHGVYSLTIKVQDYTLQGPPTITASFIDQVLAQAGSPAAGTGQQLYSLGVQYGIDPVYALAFFHVSNYGTSGKAAITHSLGNVGCDPDRPCIDAKHGGYAVMHSWTDGFDHWYSLMANLYIKQWQRTTVEQIIPKYAPSSGGNDEQAFISAVEQDVVQWRAEGGQA
jgi:hypothetical protein